MKKRIRGGQLFVFAGDEYTPLGASADCSLSAECERVEVCTRIAHQRRSRAGKMRWAISCQGFSAFGAQSSQVGQPIRVVFSLIKKELIEAGVNLPSISPHGEVSVRGAGIITEVAFGGSVGGVATYKLNIQGDGYLEAWVDDGYGFPYVFPLIFS